MHHQCNECAARDKVTGSDYGMGECNLSSAKSLMITYRQVVEVKKLSPHIANNGELPRCFNADLMAF